MALSDFKTISEVLERFRITYTVKDFVHLEEIPGTPSEQFLQEFEFCLQNMDNLPVLFGAIDAVFKASTEARSETG